MSLPAADLPAPIAVLVLAWDEATPAVRALVEATQASAPAVDSILVMVPQANAPDHLSAEEYLPLPPADYAAALAEAEPAIPQPADVAEVTPSPATAPASRPLAPSAPSQTPAPGPDAADLSPLAPESSASPAPEVEAATREAAPAALGWAAVRVLRLGNYSLAQLAQRAGQPLPAPIWTGTAELPAAPYLGAAAPAAAPGAPSPTAPGAPAESGFSPSLIPGAAALASETASTTSSHPAVAPEPLATAPRAGFYEPAEPQPQAALETDLPLSAEEEIEVLGSGSPDDLLSEEPLALPSAVQAGWPEALAALHQPTTLAEPAQTDLPPTAASPAPAALQPAATHYPAPDLNYQVIQYARFAVPVALAEADFAVIYAPAWPTWLAAQELRQRTGRPLVLHVSTLAAADDEPVGTATGWMAELQRQALQRADLILTETPALAARLRHELGLPAGLVLAIAAADAVAIAQALHTARPRPVASQR
ncbi:MAG: glycosyltransferase [Janthinobacterium lividum]